MTTTDIKPQVAYGQVTGYFVEYLADSADAGTIPDERPLTGNVTISPLTPVTRWPTTSPPRMAVAQPVVAQVVAGVLVAPDGSGPGVWLVATDQAQGQPNTIQYRATFRFDDVTVQPNPVVFNIPAGGTVDLALVESQTPEVPVITVVSHEDAERAEAAADRAEAAADAATAPTDEMVAALIANPSSDTSTALTAEIRDEGNNTQKWVQGDGTFRNMRPSGYNKAGVIDWGYGSGVPGYLLHFQAQAGSVFNEFAIGIGTDVGSGGGVLLALKNSAGVGLRILQDPGSAVGIYHDVYSSNVASWTRVFSGGGAFRVDSAAGQGFTDGSATTGSATFTSASAAFTAGDTGATLTITHTSAGAAVNATYTITYVNATTVTLSSNASLTGTNLRFTISGRVASTGQSLIESRDTDGSTVLAKIGRGEHLLSGTVGQGSSIFKVLKGGNATAVLEVDSTGKVIHRFASDANNAGQTGAIPLAVRNFGTGVPSVQVQGVASQGTDQVRIIDVGGTIQSRFDKDGYFMTRKTSVPADAALANGELAIWLDQTAGATKAMFRAKDSAGTVRSASVALS